MECGVWGVGCGMWGVECGGVGCGVFVSLGGFGFRVQGSGFGPAVHCDLLPPSLPNRVTVRCFLSR